MSVALGIDVGGTKILGVALAPDGTILDERRRPTTQDLDALVENSSALAGELLADHGAVAAGFGIAGIVDADGNVPYAPNIRGLRDAPLRRALEERLGVPVVVDNDVNATAWGEFVYGAAASAHHTLVITLGTGIGGGVVLDGVLQHGAHGFAGEVGHITVERDGPVCACGQRGHWEAVASGTALGRLGRELVDVGRGDALVEAAGGDPAAVNGEAVTVAARSGDPEALDVVARFVDHVAVGLAAVVNVTDPEIVVVGGGLVSLGPLLFEPLGPLVNERLLGAGFRPEVPVVPAELGEHAGAIGAAELARLGSGHR